MAADSNPNETADKKKRSVPTKKSTTQLAKRQALTSPSGAELIGYPRRNFLAPPYQIDNANTFDAIGGLSNFTLDADIVHYDGHVELDVHNLYGSQMSEASRIAMLARRPERRPLVITRSTFAGAGRSVGKWLGDNLSTWAQYRNSIQGMLNFATLFQIPMVGSDVCGFGANTTETLCARWVTLGAFYTFMRNHNGDTSIPQELYLWDTVAEAARNALDIRYRLLDYIYTGFHRQTVDGTPVLSPLWFVYPADEKTFGNQLQFFYGDALLISPVTEENSTSVTAYLPDDRFYKWGTWEVVEGQGKEVNLTNVAFTEISIHVRGGSILPVRQQSGYTTTETRKSPFEVIVAPGRDGKARGTLYLDDGDSLVQAATSEIIFEYENGELAISGTFGYTTDALLSSVKVLGGLAGGLAPSYKKANAKEQTCREEEYSHDVENGVLTVQVNEPLDGELVVRV